LVDV